jgi:long-chain acyl-CoA synthetase
MYGLTECKRVSYLPPELLDFKPGSVGIAIPGTEVYLRSPRAARGRRRTRHPACARAAPDARLLEQPEANRRDAAPGDIPGERVLCTGDWFRMDEDGFCIS